MCKEDIRLARAAAVKTRYEWSAGGVKGSLPPPDPNRYSVIAGFIFVDGTAADICVDVFSRVGGLRMHLAVLTADHPFAVMTIQDYGQALMEAIDWESTSQDAPTTMSIISTGFNEDIKGI